MRTGFATAVAVVATFASQAAATLYVTDPTSSSSCSATLACNVTWKDDGTSPALASIGPSRVDLCTGDRTRQTCLQNIATNLDVSTTNNITYHNDPKVGPTGKFYFIKFTSNNLKDPSNPGFPYTAYSAVFNLVGMGGPYVQSIEEPQKISTSAGSSTAATGTATLGAGNISSLINRSSSAATATDTSVVATTTVAGNGAATLTVPGVMASLVGVTAVASVATVYLGMMVLGL